MEFHSSYMAHKTHLFGEMSTVLESYVRKTGDSDGGSVFAFNVFGTVLSYCFIVKFNG